jgi:hypothetical protein
VALERPVTRLLADSKAFKRVITPWRARGPIKFESQDDPSFDKR